MVAKIAFLFLASCAIVYSAPSSSELENVENLPKGLEVVERRFQRGQKSAEDAFKRKQQILDNFGRIIGEVIKGSIEQGHKTMEGGVKIGQNAFQDGSKTFADVVKFVVDNIKTGIEQSHKIFEEGIKSRQDAFQKRSKVFGNRRGPLE